MINLAVINLKILIKNAIKIIVIISIVAMIIKFSFLVYNNAKNFDVHDFEISNNIEIIKSNIAISKSFDVDNKSKKSELKKILVAELAIFSGAEEEIMEKENQEEVLEFENIKTDENVKVDEKTEQVEHVENQVPIEENKVTNVKTSIIETNNKKDVYTDMYKTVKIKNESKYPLTEAMVTPDRKYSNTKDIIIYHTHTCESYTPTASSQYVATGNYRTTDTNYSVARVGFELANNLAGKGYTVIHDKTYHDYPAYTGSYTRSLSTIKNLLGTYKDVEAVFDIHRDALRK